MSKSVFYQFEKRGKSMDVAETSQKLKAIPKETLQLLHQLLIPLANSTVNGRGFRLKQIFSNNYAFFAFSYGLLGGLGEDIKLFNID